MPLPLLRSTDDEADRLERAFWRLVLADRLLWRGLPSESPRFERKQQIVDALHRLRPPSTEEQPLAELDGQTVTREAFVEASNNFRRPVILRGFARDNPAVNTWTPDYLSERLAGETCTVLAWTSDVAGRDWDVGAKVAQMPFAEFFSRMADEPIYLNANTEVVTKRPELAGDLDLDRIQRIFATPGSSWDELVFLNFFIGSSNVHSQLHTAPGGNFFLMVRGRKRWTLMNPAHSAYIHPVTKSPFQYYRSAFGGYRSQRELGANEEHPLWQSPLHTVELEPGDMLYNAPWWWHEVENLDAFTVGVAVRHGPPPFRRAPSWDNHGLFTATSMYPAVRAMAYAHFLAQKWAGYSKPMREWLHPINDRMLASWFRKAELERDRR